LLGVLVTAIVVLGGIIVWRTFVDMTPNHAGSSMVMESNETATGTERVDTGIVVRQEQANSTATTVTADITAAEQTQNVSQSPDRPAVPAERSIATAAAVPTNSEVASSQKPAQGPATAVSDRPSTKSPAMPSSAPANAPAKTRPSMAITPAPKGTPVYVVQVFASPARDDAEEWMQILRSRNVRDGFISEQRIKGETWYRVRFGQYSKRQDAENAALKVGVEQPWIARIK
jgi:cell division septation protein DedD